MDTPSSQFDPSKKADPIAEQNSSVGGLRTRAYQFIQSRIFSGQLPAGELVSELSLARAIGMSRTPVREAIGQLVAEGFLDQKPGRGTTVKKLTRNDIAELYDLREALEIYTVAQVAARRVHDADLAELDRLCDAIPALAKTLDGDPGACLDEAGMQRFSATDMGFHMVLLRLAGNRRIMKVVADTRLLIQIFAMRRRGHDATLLAQIHHYHDGIASAVRAGNAETAMRLVSEHVLISKQERLDEFDLWERRAKMHANGSLLGLELFLTGGLQEP